MKKLFLSVLTVLILSTSCSKDETSEKTTNTSEQVLKKVNNSIIKDFAAKHVSISKEILSLFNESEANLQFTENSYEEVLNLKTENELKEYFNEKGLNNTDRFISLLKDLKTNYFLINDEIKNLSIDEQKKLIEEAIVVEMDNDLTLAARPSCREQLEIDKARCDRNQVIGLGFSWLGGVLTGGVGGVLGAAASSTAYHFCLQDAAADYRACAGIR